MNTVDSNNNLLNIHRIAIAVELSSRKVHVMQLFTMLYPSWLYVKSLSHLSVSELLEHQQLLHHKWDKNISTISSKPIHIDLLIFCEPISCHHLPIDCQLLDHLQEIYISHPSTFKAMESMCFYHKLDDEYTQRTVKTGYRFITSLQFLIEKPFTDIVHFYDYILRTDMDAFIAPLMLLYVPKTKAIFSDCYMGSPFTDHRLEQMSKKLNLKHAHLHQMQSSWYVEASSFIKLASNVINITMYLYHHEFTDDICENITNSNFTDPYNNASVIEDCRWPHWLRGVSSLYGQNIAVNHVFYDDFIKYKNLYNIDIEQWKTILLDLNNRNNLIGDTLQIHVISQKHKITQQIQRIGTIEDVKKLCTDSETSSKLVDYENISSALTAFQYAARIFAHSLRDACAILMIHFNEISLQDNGNTVKKKRNKKQSKDENVKKNTRI